MGWARKHSKGIWAGCLLLAGWWPASGCALVELTGDEGLDVSGDGGGEGGDATAGDGQSVVDATKSDTSQPQTDGGADAATVDSSIPDTSIADSAPLPDGAPPPPACNDGIKNGSETDVDCGGSCSTKCASGKGCSIGGDCTTATCTANRCVWIITVGPNGNTIFSPANLTIKAGDTIKYVWASSGHTVNGGSNCNPSGGWCSPNDTNCNNNNTSNNGATYLHTFSPAGSYPYFCSPHCGSMKGTITVQ